MRARALGLTGVLHVAGYRNDADALLAAADVAVLSSREEGMGSVLLDALAARQADRGDARRAEFRTSSSTDVTGLLAPVGDSGGARRATSLDAAHGSRRSRSRLRARRRAHEPPISRSSE